MGLRRQWANKPLKTFTEALSAFRTAISFRFFDWLTNNRDVFASHTNSQVITLQILLCLISRYKTVQISKLTNYFQLPIKSESKRKHIQRFLSLKELSLP